MSVKNIYEWKAFKFIVVIAIKNCKSVIKCIVLGLVPQTTPTKQYSGIF